jgi:hypothetical protein
MMNADKIYPLLKKNRDNTDDLKHLADCMDLCAKALNRLGRHSGDLRIQAMKFYEMARAFDSQFRAGQELVDEFVERNDYIGARGIFETILLPYIAQVKLAARVIPIRSQYAVVLAYCGDFGAAEREMARLAPYEAGLSPEGQYELRNQRALINKLRLIPPPLQWQMKPVRLPRPQQTARQAGRKVGANEPCPCGSGKKFKKCHGKR